MKVSPIELQKCLRGMDYPADKTKLRNHVEDSCDNEEVVDAVNELPEKSYDSPADVSKAVKELG